MYFRLDGRIQYFNRFSSCMKTNHSRLKQGLRISRVDKENTVSMPKISNIFNDRVPQTRDVFKCKNYEIVGLKELKSMEFKMRKTNKKNSHRRDTKYNPTSRLDISQSRQSEFKDDMMTKQEVIDSLPKIHKRNPSDCLKRVNRTHWRTQLSELEQSAVKISKKTDSQLKEQEFSLSRLRCALEERNQEWKKLKNKINRQNEKFPSVYKSVDLYRSKVEEKEKTVHTLEMANQNSNKWEHILRNQLSLADLTHKKVITRTFHDQGKFTTRGNSKFKSEQQWLDKKQLEGYQFKKYAHQDLSHSKVAETVR